MCNSRTIRYYTSLHWTSLWLFETALGRWKNKRQQLVGSKPQKFYQGRQRNPLSTQNEEKWRKSLWRFKRPLDNHQFASEDFESSFNIPKTPVFGANAIHRIPDNYFRMYLSYFVQESDHQRIYQRRSSILARKNKLKNYLSTINLFNQT